VLYQPASVVYHDIAAPSPAILRCVHFGRGDDRDAADERAAGEDGQDDDTD